MFYIIGAVVIGGLDFVGFWGIDFPAGFEFLVVFLIFIKLDFATGLIFLIFDLLASSGFLKF